MFIMVNTSLIKVIKQIGFTNKHAIVYESLLKKPDFTPLELARKTKLNRSSLYRYLEELRMGGLVELVLADKSSKYRANPEGLNQYLAKEESRLEQLKRVIPEIVSSIQQPELSTGTQVKYFQGVEGLKQMLWNVIASRREYVGLGYKDWNSSVGKTFAEKLRAKNMETGAKSREISNQSEAGLNFTNLGENYQKIYSHRRIDPKILIIKHDTYIYGSVFAYYYHFNGEYFGIEIHNEEIAMTEKQMFEVLWRMAK